MPSRKPRSDIKIGNLEKKLGLPEGAIRNPDGSNARSDKLLKTLRKEYQRIAAGPPVRSSASVKAAAATAHAKQVSQKSNAAPKPKRSPSVAKAIAKPAPAASLKGASKQKKK